MHALSFLTEFVLPASSGDTNIDWYFPGKVVKIDNKFRAIVVALGETYATVELECRIYQAEKAEDNDAIIIETFGMQFSTDVNRICAILSYLGGEGSHLLDIPAGEQEVNLILGYVTIDSVRFVLFVEHEFEHGEEEFHLHARTLNRWGDDAPRVIVAR